MSTGETLTVAQLTGSSLCPRAGAFAQSSSFAYTVFGPDGVDRVGECNAVMGPNNTPLVTTPASLTVAENSGATAIGIMRRRATRAICASDVKRDGNGPANGRSVLLSNGTTPVTLGESSTVAQLTSLLFKPTQDNTGQSSSFAYTVSDPAGKPRTARRLLTTGPNPIVAREQKPGTPESVWQIDPGQRFHEIQGFTTRSARMLVGRSISRSDNQTGNGNYEINIYRLGYYGGEGAPRQHHPASVDHRNRAARSPHRPGTGLVDAGNWQVTDSGTYHQGHVRCLRRQCRSTARRFSRSRSSSAMTARHSDIVFQTR